MNKCFTLLIVPKHQALGRLDQGIKEYYIHPKYDNITMYYDVAIIRLNQTIEYTDSIRPICLPPSSSAGNTT